MKRTNLLLLAVLAACLAGCAGMSKTTTTEVTNPDGTKKTTVVEEPASLLGPSDYSDGYTDGYRAFVDGKARMAEACKSDLPENASPVERAYSDAMSKMCVQTVSNQRFEMQKPTTGTDVLNTLAGELPLGLAIKTTGDVAKAGIKNAGSSYGDGAQLSNSGNRTDSQNTVAGRDNSGTSSASGTGEPTVVKVEPVFAPTE